jgi:hypothetical protein
MQNLEHKILNNRQEFDHAEPASGHFGRFTEKLRRANMGKRFPIPYYLRVAAVLLFVSLSSIVIYELIRPSQWNTTYTIGRLSPEYREVEDFFIYTINSKYDILESLYNGESEQAKVIRNELKEMDIMFKNLSKELENDPNNERLINAMIQHYQMKLDILNSIISQLEDIKKITSKNNKYENKEI